VDAIPVNFKINSMTKNIFCKLVTNCIPVLGYNRALVYDLQRQKYDFVPKTVFDLFSGGKTVDYARLSQSFEDKQLELILEYIRFLDEQEYLLWGEREFLDNFVELSSGWYHSSDIMTAIIDVPNDDDLVHLINKLCDYGCRNLVLKFSQHIDLSIISQLLHIVEYSFIENIIIVARYNADLHSNPVFSGASTNRRVHSIYLVSDIVSIEDYESDKVFIINETHFDLDCLELDLRLKPFAVNIQLFFESLNYNPYFNKKVFIDSKGCLKLYFAGQSLGRFLNINDLARQLGEKSIGLWDVTKDKITVCSDCELRYMCLTSNVPRLRVDGSYFFEKECPYNPYLSLWEGSEGYLSLNECSIQNDFNSFKVCEDKLAEINSSLWT
jgi:SPASM domain peptide maturase of grasp-with-spasm system